MIIWSKKYYKLITVQYSIAWLCYWVPRQTLVRLAGGLGCLLNKFDLLNMLLEQNSSACRGHGVNTQSPNTKENTYFHKADCFGRNVRQAWNVCTYMYTCIHITWTHSHRSYHILSMVFTKFFLLMHAMFGNENLVNYWFIFIANKCLLTQNHDKVCEELGEFSSVFFQNLVNELWSMYNFSTDNRFAHLIMYSLFWNIIWNNSFGYNPCLLRL